MHRRSVRLDGGRADSRGLAGKILARAGDTGLRGGYPPDDHAAPEGRHAVGVAAHGRRRVIDVNCKKRDAKNLDFEMADKKDTLTESPKVFISYSWTTPEHEQRVLSWAEHLIADGIDVILDKYDLKEGNDKNAFMESMITDSTVTHVLAFCDQAYKEKADARKAGVGTESQIISQEVYAKIKNDKFIPIVCEFSPDGKPYLPVFFESRIWLDFSSPEAVAENWQKLIKLLYGKSIFEKPALGKPPTYITESNNQPPNLISPKFAIFKQQLVQGRPGAAALRSDFFASCIEFADALRIRQHPDLATLSQKIITDFSTLKIVRNFIVDWLLLEANIAQETELAEIVIGLLEELLRLKGKAPELNQYNNAWFEAHDLFAFETYLYCIAALLKTQKYKVLHEIFATHYLISDSDSQRNQPFVSFTKFIAFGRLIENSLSIQGQRYLSPAAELLRRNADRQDLPFRHLMEADLLAFLMSCLGQSGRWFPQTFYYSSYGYISPFFTRCAQVKYFEKLLIISGFSDREELKVTTKKAVTEFEQSRPNFHDDSLESALNIDKWGTLK